ncbi:MAG: hypothetical protein IIB13_05070 [Chloroflexi bacterium]|nr:hypothetical protein [Chloroflexota bacterium]
MRRSFLRLGACPRCKGDIIVDQAYEDSELCLQCGFRGRVIPDYGVNILERRGRKREYKLSAQDRQLLNSD